MAYRRHFHSRRLILCVRFSVSGRRDHVFTVKVYVSRFFFFFPYTVLDRRRPVVPNALFRRFLIVKRAHAGSGQ